MTVCIDTNSFVQLFGKRSRFRVIAEALLGGRLELTVSSAILLEYQSLRKFTHTLSQPIIS